MADLATRLRDWLHETPLSLCDTGSDSCPDWDLALPLARAIKSNEDDDWDTLRIVTLHRIEVLRKVMRHG